MRTLREISHDLGRILGTTVGQMWVIYVMTMVFFLFTMVWPGRILSMKEPFKIISPPRAGGYVEYELDFCKNYSLPGYVVVQLVNSHSIVIAQFRSNIPDGCNKYRGKHPVPSYMPLGPTQIRWTAHYDPWPWVSKDYMFMSEWTEVGR